MGCAKSRLVGTHKAVAQRRGATSNLIFDGGIVGAVLRTRTRVKPVYVSPGHLADLPTSVELILASSRRFRLPEPIRLAHRATDALRRRLDPHVEPPTERSYPSFVKQDPS